jgi:hypothetical protein
MPPKITAIDAPAPREGVENEKETVRLLRQLRDFANRFRSQTFVWDPPAVPAFSTADANFAGDSFTGMLVGLPVSVTPPGSIPAGLVATGFVGTLDTLTVRLANVTAAPINAPGGTWAFLALTSL